MRTHTHTLLDTPSRAHMCAGNPRRFSHTRPNAKRAGGGGGGGRSWVTLARATVRSRLHHGSSRRSRRRGDPRTCSGGIICGGDQLAGASTHDRVPMYVRSRRHVPSAPVVERRRDASHRIVSRRDVPWATRHPAFRSRLLQIPAPLSDRRFRNRDYFREREWYLRVDDDFVFVQSISWSG